MYASSTGSSRSYGAKRLVVALVGAELGGRRPLDRRAGISSRPARSLRCRESRKTSVLKTSFSSAYAADHVAVDRRVADGQLRLVARRDDEPAVGVRERHQRSCRGSAPGGSRPPGLRARRAPRGTPRRRPRSGSHGSRRRGSRSPRGRRRASPPTRTATASTPRARAPRRARRRRWRPSAPSRSHRRSRRRRRRTRSSRRSRGRPIAERQPHLLELRRERLDRRGVTGSRRRRGRAEAERRRDRRMSPVFARAPRRRTSRSRRPIASVGSTSTTSSASSKPGRARDDLALVVEHDRMTVEDELVLAADEVAERDVATRCRARA